MHFKWLITVFAGVIVFAPSALAQMATLTGLVQDASGATIPRASVELTNPATGQVRVMTTSADGSYLFPALPPMAYRLRVTADGFNPVTVTRIELQVEQVGRQDITLNLASVSQEVTITGGVPLLQTEEASTGQVIETKQVVDLPLNGRNFKQLALLLPGTVGATRQSTDGTAFNIPRAQFVSNGVLDQTYSYRVDGIENFHKLLTINTLDMSVDAIQEFKIEQNSFQVDSGRGTTVTSLITKSGTNQVHGSVYEFFRNDKLDARNFFDREQSGGKPPFRMNQFGASLGGPIVKDSLFFFVNAEARRSVKGLTQFANFPTTAQLNGDLRGTAPAVDPDRIGSAGCATGREPGCFWENNIIPANRISQFALATNSYWPAPNAIGILPGFNHVQVLKQRNNFTQQTARIDWQASGKDRLFFRETTDSSRFDRPNIQPLQELNTTYHTSNLAASWTRTINPRAVNEFLFGYNFGNYRLEVPFTASDVSSNFGLRNLILKPDYYGPPRISVSGNGTIGAAAYEPWVEPERIFQWTDNVTLIRGSHTLKMGGEFMRYSNLSTQPFANRGTMSFTGLVSGNPLADYLLGHLASASAGQGDTTRDHRRYIMTAYAGDDWRVRPNLTLNIGLRWDAATQPTEKLNRMAIFDPDLAQFPGDAAGSYRQAAVNGESRSILKSQLKTFAPRVGFAYRPGRSDRFVIRGGFGTSYALAMQGQDEQFFAVNLPFLFLNSLVSQGPTRFFRTTELFPAPPPLFPDPNAKFEARGQGLYTMPQTMKFPTSYQWNFAVQTSLARDLSLDLAYVGDANRHGKSRWDINQAILPSAAEVASGVFSPFASRRPFPTLANIISSPNWGNSNYHALQTKLIKRSAHGTALVSYTWAKAIDDFGIAQYEGGAYFHQRSLERSRAGADTRHSASFSYNYELPIGPGRRFLPSVQGALRLFVEGWAVNGITTFRTGLPLTVFDRVNRTQTGGGTPRPDRICDGNLPTDQRSPNRWFDLGCFTAPRAGTLGTSGRRIIDGPGINNFDFSVFKRFTITESLRLEFRGEFYNIFNHAQFEAPGMTYDTPAFGVITSARDPRDIQLGLKLVF